MKEWQNIITIDGPSGAGKGTIASIVSRKLGYSYLDTGAMYRAVALAVKRSGTDINDKEQLRALLGSTEIEIATNNNGETDIYLNGEIVNTQLRSTEVTNLSSDIARIGMVRDFLVKKQKEIAKRGEIVVEGRDMGTYVFPEAKYKFYLDASLTERARRRHSQLEDQGNSVSLGKVKNNLIARDKQDMEREESPLHPASNAVIIDTTELTISEVVDLIVNVVVKRQNP